MVGLLLTVTVTQFFQCIFVFLLLTVSLILNFYFYIFIYFLFFLLLTLTLTLTLTKTCTSSRFGQAKRDTEHALWRWTNVSISLFAVIPG